MTIRVFLGTDAVVTRCIATMMSGWKVLENAATHGILVVNTEMKIAQGSNQTRIISVRVYHDRLVFEKILARHRRKTNRIVFAGSWAGRN